MTTQVFGWLGGLALRVVRVLLVLMTTGFVFYMSSTVKLMLVLLVLMAISFIVDMADMRCGEPNAIAAFCRTLEAGQLR